MEQPETALAWMEDKHQMLRKRRKRRATFTTCCPEFRPLSAEQLENEDHLQFINQPDCFFAQNCTTLPHSGVRGTGFRGEFQKFGVSFWDNERMKSLGLTTKWMDRWTDQKELAFRWSGMLLSREERDRNKWQEKGLAIPESNNAYSVRRLGWSTHTCSHQSVGIF